MAGFTLIEVLIGATILAVMMTLLSSALFAFTRSARAGEARLDEIDSAHLVYAFLRRQLEGASPLTERADGEEHVLFEGRAERLRFVGHLPGEQRGGLQFFDVSAAPQGAALGWGCQQWTNDGEAQARPPIATAVRLGLVPHSPAPFRRRAWRRLVVRG